MKCEIFHLADIDITKLKLIKETVQWYDNQDHSRWVLRNARKSGVVDKRDLYFKMWNPTYIRRDNILMGIDVGFYDVQTTPALIGLVFHRGICRGYVMRRCKRNWKLELDDSFYRLIKERSAETGYFHYQFSPYHVMRYEGAYSLVDLEGIYPLHAMHSMADYHCIFDYKDYEDFIASLYYERVPQPGGQHRYGASYNMRQFHRAPLVVRGSRFLRSKALDFLWKTRMNHVHLIER